MINIITPNFTFNDERGSLVQLVREGYKQVNIVTSKAGCFRGGHYHRINRETFYVFFGELELTARRDKEIEKRIFSAGDMFSIAPMISHDFQFLQDTVLIGLYDVGVEMSNGEKDIIRSDIS